MRELEIKKVLNNNVVIAKHPVYHEVVLIGKGLGFQKKTGEKISGSAIEKLFILVDKKEQEQYKELLSHVDHQIAEAVNDAILHIQKRFTTPLSEHIHVSLMDHIAFAIKRLEQGLEFNNPFLLEMRSMYEKEFQVADEIVNLLKKRLGVEFPESEIGFIAMHIHSAVTRRDLSEIRKHYRLIMQLIQMVENSLETEIDRQSISYLRLITHLRFAIERTVRGEEVMEPAGLTELLRKQYPLCYNIAWKLSKVIERQLHKPVHPAEISYLSLHLQRLIARN